MKFYMIDNSASNVCKFYISIGSGGLYISRVKAHMAGLVHEEGVLLISHNDCMKVGKDQLLLDSLANDILNESFHACNVFQHVLVRLTYLALDINRRQ